MSSTGPGAEIARSDVRELIVVHAIEERLAAEDYARLGLRIAGALWAALDLKRANREGNGDLLPAEFVPDVGPDRIADIVVITMIAQRELDLVNHG